MLIKNQEDLVELLRLIQQYDKEHSVYCESPDDRPENTALDFALALEEHLLHSEATTSEESYAIVRNLFAFFFSLLATSFKDKQMVEDFIHHEFNALKDLIASQK